MPSTLIRSFTYDEAAHRLEVEFVSGALYHYSDVPEDVAAGMRRAFAKGEFFNRYIRGQYAYSRVRDS